MNITWIPLVMLILTILGSAYGIIKLIIKSEEVNRLEKENDKLERDNEYLKRRIDEKDDALRKLKI